LQAEHGDLPVGGPTASDGVTVASMQLRTYVGKVHDGDGSFWGDEDVKEYVKYILTGDNGAELAHDFMNQLGERVLIIDMPRLD
jgi:hypothetical protein